MRGGSVTRETVLMSMPWSLSAFKNGAAPAEFAKMAFNAAAMRSRSALAGWVMITPTPVFEGSMYADACMHSMAATEASMGSSGVSAPSSATSGLDILDHAANGIP